MLSAIAVLAIPSPLVQVGVIFLGGLFGWMNLHADTPTDHVDLGVRVNRKVAIGALGLFFAGLIIWIVVAVYVLYREILGLIRVLDSRAY